MVSRVMVVLVSLPFSDMLQLIGNQDMEFGGLFDNPPYSVPPPTQELPVLTQTITSAAPPTTTTTPPSTSSSSILSSSPHLDALLGPPINRRSSKTFQPTTFQQSPLAQVPSSTQRQQPASPQQQQPPQSLRQPQVEQPPPILSPAAPVQAASPHGSPAPNPAFSSAPQALFTTPVPQTSPQPQTTLQAQTQPQQAPTTYNNQNSFKGKRSLMVMSIYYLLELVRYSIIQVLYSL